MINTIQKHNIKYFNSLSWLSPLSFICRIEEDYGFFKAHDLAVFVPIEIRNESPSGGSIVIVNNRIGLLERDNNFDFYLYSLDDNHLIFAWDRHATSYQIKGLFTGILRRLN